MRRHPWWGCPPLAENENHLQKFKGVNKYTVSYLRVKKGSLVICRPVEPCPKWIPMSLQAHLWQGNRGSATIVKNGTYAVYLGRKGPYIKLLIDGVIYRSHARRWGLVNPPKKLTRFSSRGVPLR